MPDTILLSTMACVCLFVVVARLRSRLRDRDRRMADSFTAAVRAERI
jgi:hypothetical protein